MKQPTTAHKQTNSLERRIPLTSKATLQMFKAIYSCGKQTIQQQKSSFGPKISH